MGRIMKVPRRWRGFLDDDGRMQWKAFRRHLRSVWYVNWWRIDNRWQDLRARLAGACNADTWDGKPPDGYAGGYSHWRCGKARGHADTPARMDSAHRFNNYVWDGPGHKVEYAPLPIRNDDNTGWFDALTVIPFRKLAGGRHAVESRGRARQRARWHQEQMALYRTQRMQERLLEEEA